MYSLRRFHGARFERMNAIIDSLGGYITSYINLIGSATLPLPEVCSMEGLPATACRVEGHKSARLFPATDPIDKAEAVIDEGVRQIFGLDQSYLISAQPHSATQANHAVFRAVLADTTRPVVCLSPSDGGHVSHRLGLPATTELIPMPVGPRGIDYDMTETLVRRHRPALIVAGGTSYTRAIDYERLRLIADGLDCHLHADIAHTAPFVATGEHPSVFPFADSVTLDPGKNLRGPRGGILVYRERDAKEMQRAIFPVLQTSPNQNAILAKAACINHWSTADLQAYAARMVKLARILCAQLESCLGAPIYDGTDTHLLLFDLTPVSIGGREAETLLERCQILVNRNQIPGDTGSPWAPSGIRLGSTILAILGYTTEDTEVLGTTIAAILSGAAIDEDPIERLLDTYHRQIVNISSE